MRVRARPHFWRAPGRALYDDLGAGYTLLKFGAAAPDPAPLVAAFAQCRVPLTVLQIDDPAAALKYEQYALVLVRPDHHIAWRAHALPAAPAGVVATLTGSSSP